MLKSAATLSKTSPERLIFEKTGVEIQCRKCCGHLDMTPTAVVLLSWEEALLLLEPTLTLTLMSLALPGSLRMSLAWL